MACGRKAKAGERSQEVGDSWEEPGWCKKELERPGRVRGSKEEAKEGSLLERRTKMQHGQ